MFRLIPFQPVTLSDPPIRNIWVLTLASNQELLLPFRCLHRDDRQLGLETAVSLRRPSRNVSSNSELEGKLGDPVRQPLPEGNSSSDEAQWIPNSENRFKRQSVKRYSSIRLQVKNIALGFW